MAVYLIHMERKLQHAQHYIGCTCNIKIRFRQHRNGNGSKMLAAANDKGINYQVVRVWSNGDWALERRLKNQHNAWRLCPECNPDHYMNREREN